MIVSLKVTSVLLLVITAVTGCTYSTGCVIGTPLHGSPKRSADITVVEHIERRDYRVVGRVHAHSLAPIWLPWLLVSEEELLKHLKSEAALLYSEVIFDVKRYSRSQFEWQEEHLMGTAAILLSKEADNGP
jgi:hypothetical protein